MEKEIFDLRKRLSEETDPEVIQEIQKVISSKERQIQVLSEKQAADRKPIGANLNFGLTAY